MNWQVGDRFIYHYTKKGIHAHEGWHGTICQLYLYGDGEDGCHAYFDEEPEAISPSFVYLYNMQPDLACVSVDVSDFL